MTYLARNLRFLRKQAGLSQTAFANQIGINRSNVASYEKGIAEPKATVLLKIIKFFKLELNHLLEKDLDDLGYQVEKGTYGTFEIVHNSKVDKPFLMDFIKQTENLEKILSGFQEFHLYKMSNPDSANSKKDLEMLIHDYEKILELLERYLKLNKELISKIEFD